MLTGLVCNPESELTSWGFLRRLVRACERLVESPTSVVVGTEHFPTV
jgi:hypothetical protein